MDLVTFYTTMALIILATAYFYFWRYRDKKPMFINVIFLLLNLFWPVHLAVTLQGKTYYETGSTLYWCINFANLFVAFDLAVAHWVFAIKYFEVAINTPIFLKSSELSAF